MNKKKLDEKTQVITFRLPYSVYDNYERNCIELQVSMSQVLRQAVNKFLTENSEKTAKGLPSLYQVNE